MNWYAASPRMVLMTDLLLQLDVRTLMAVLLLGNATSVALILCHRLAQSHMPGEQPGGMYLYVKALQTVAYLLLMGRDTLPLALSVNLGNSLLMAGFYFEALAMLSLIGAEGRTARWLGWLLFICIAGFNAAELLRPDTSLRVALSSIGVFLILVVPNVRLLLSVRTTRFIQCVGLFYSGFIVVLVPRTVQAFLYPTSILSNTHTPIQSLTFLAMVMLLVFSLSAYLLLMKEESDKMIAAMATTDFLTSLANRRHFYDTAAALFRRQATTWNTS